MDIQLRLCQQIRMITTGGFKNPIIKPYAYITVSLMESLHYCELVWLPMKQFHVRLYWWCWYNLYLTGFHRDAS